MINEAPSGAVRAGRKTVTQEDLEESIEVVIAGYQKKDRVLSDKEKKIVAYHEVGHALRRPFRAAPPRCIRSPSSQGPRRPGLYLAGG